MTVRSGELVWTAAIQGNRADCTWVPKVSVMQNRVWVLVNVSRGLKYRQMSLHKLCLILAIAAPDYSGYGDFLGFEKV